ncbi:unnamed protein product [Angiostrongylus costaricensis]|uniref:Lipase_3 domain-containing protein n=1 Tax=Angiostrongylus costaricensis TaxID=334426 RepID=A0A158PLM2_ANGCS|nr:unnamed protein product [Angiostrongylus costaricensis]
MILLLWQFCYSTLSAPTPNATYLDVVARTKMLPLASAAYSKRPQDCLTNRFTNAVLKRRLNVECDPIKVDTCSGYSAILDDDKAYRPRLQSPWIAGGKVSKYFNTAFMALLDAGIKDDFNALISLGAVASLAASYIIAANLTFSGRVQLVTFGQPRTGDKDFAHAHDKQVFYYNNMREDATFKVCQADEDNECSDGLGITTSIFEHLHYFDVDVSHYGIHGCQ